MQPIYELNLEDEPSVTITANAVIDAFADTLPAVVAAVLDLATGRSVRISQEPCIAVRRVT